MFKTVYDLHQRLLILGTYAGKPAHYLRNQRPDQSQRPPAETTPPAIPRDLSCYKVDDAASNQKSLSRGASGKRDVTSKFCADRLRAVGTFTVTCDERVSEQTN